MNFKTLMNYFSCNFSLDTLYFAKFHEINAFNMENLIKKHNSIYEGYYYF